MQPSRREMALAVKPPRWVTRATAQARHGQLTRCGLRWYDLMRCHRNCCSTQPPSLPPAPALQPQPRARASHAAEQTRNGISSQASTTWATRAIAGTAWAADSLLIEMWHDPMRYHRDCRSMQPPSLSPRAALQPQPPATISHAAD